jgi:putative ABC transport system substrate-binding protein
MRRRDFIALFGAAAVPFWPISTQAQRPKEIVKVGLLGNSKLDTPESIAGWDAFRVGLRDKGWVEGLNLVFVYRFAEGVAERHSGNAQELLDAEVGLIVATSGNAALAAKRSTTTIPIVFASLPSPVETGLVASLAQPGGNITGLTTLGLDLAGKRLQILKEGFPTVSRVAFLASGHDVEIDRSVYASAEKLGIQLVPAKAARVEELRNAMTGAEQIDAWFIGEEALFFAQRRTIIDAIAAQGTPAIYPSTFFVDAGGLISYSVGQPGQYRRLAALADRILRGAKPADIPVEQPVEFELVINMKTAQSLGLEISPLLLSRADRLIE